MAFEGKECKVASWLRRGKSEVHTMAGLSRLYIGTLAGLGIA